MPSNVKLLAGASGGEPTDANFKNVTLLLHGDGSNGAQNNTFIDSSTNNFTITRNGNTTQGSFSPYGSNWSNYFDGTGDYLTAPYSVTNSEWWTQDFTMEMWVYNNTNAVSGTNSLCLQLAHGIPASADTYWAFGTNASGQVDFYYFNGGGVRLTGTTAAALNTWNHIAMVYTHSSGNISLYLNGSRVATGTKAGTPQNSSGSTINVGVAQNTFYNGYISNLRILDGTALYSGTTYTVPTAPLTAITNTSLLTCAYNRFRDGSTNNFTITRNGDVKVTNFAPFSPSSSYSTSANGGSGYFDGTGDYLSVASNAAFGFGTGDYTVEAWVYPTSVRNGENLIYVTDTTGGLTLFYNQTQVAIGRRATAQDLTATYTMPIGAWTHIAVSRQSGTTRIYINGVEAASTTTSYNYPTGQAGIGDYPTIGNLGVMGFLANTRVVKGTAVYTANFTPPSSPVTAITNTSLLTNFTNAAIFDNSMKNDLETVGNAQISTSVKKFGTGSMYFDGNGDVLATAHSPSLDLGSGDFTLELWVNVPSTSSQQGLVVKRLTDQIANGTWGLRINSGGNLYFEDIQTPSGIVTFGTLSTNTWTHVAVTRSGSTVRGFLNGTLVSSGTSTRDFTNSYPLLIGIWGTSGGSWPSGTIDSPLNGYIDDLRITKGVARYTANFTAPTAPFPNK